METTEEIWHERVKAWRESGKSAPSFVEGKNFSASGLRYWASRVKKGAAPKPKGMTVARIVRGSDEGEAIESRVMVEVTASGPLIVVGRGFDPVLLREVVTALGRER